MDYFINQVGIIHKIYTIRGEKVMIDRDLAEIYGVETRRLNEQVKRNKDRFPLDFMFQLTEEEFKILMSQNAISRWGGIRKLPFAFTEHGVLMLSSVLSSETAIAVNIQIVRIFTRLRKTLFNHNELLLKLEKLDKKMIHLGHDVKMHDDEIETIFELINEIRADQKRINKITVIEGFVKKK